MTLVFRARGVLFSAAVLLLACGPAACGGGKAQAPAAASTPPPAAAPGPSAAPTTARITSFAVGQDNLKVDRVSMRDGVANPDGSVDLAFTADLEGPLNALFLTTVSEGGQPSAAFRANTLRSDEHAPAELGGDLEFGSMSVGIGVIEGGHFVNFENGALKLAAGPHRLTLYVANTGALRAGSHLRLYGRTPGGALVAGPVLAY